MPQEILFMGCGMRIPYKNACAVCFSDGVDVSQDMQPVNKQENKNFLFTMSIILLQI